MLKNGDGNKIKKNKKCQKKLKLVLTSTYNLVPFEQKLKIILREYRKL